MWNPDVLPIFDCLSERLYTLAEEIPAIELTPEVTGEMRLGLVSKIPADSDVECCGQGFDGRTVKVRWRGKFYFVFRQDLEIQCKPAARCACCRG